MARDTRRPALHRVTGGVALAVLAALLWAVWRHDFGVSWLEHPNPFALFAAMVLLPLVGIPVTPLYVLAGAVFTPWIGLLGSLVALAVNLVLSFWIARSGLRPRLIGLMQRTQYTLPDLEATPADALRFALVVKLAPGLPLSFKHYAIAAARVPFATYFAVSFVISGFYLASLVVLGESLMHHDVGRLLVIGAALVLLAILVTHWQRRRRDATSVEAMT